MDIRRRSLVAAALSAALVVSGLIAPATAKKAKKPKKPKKNVCMDAVDEAKPLTLTVEGEEATGAYALPAAAPKNLVVFAHGYGHTSASWAHHMQTAAKDHGALAVTMDYRGIEISPDSSGDGLPESRGWNAMKGAQDLIAAAQHFDGKCKSIEQVTLMGVSMGANMSGLALALTGANDIKRANGKPLFDYWVDVEGSVNLIETYLAARAAGAANATAANAKTDIEQETGGPIEGNEDAYLERTVVYRMDDIAASGVRGAVVLHGLDDGLVPYNQGREMATRFREIDVPTEMVTIGMKSEESERETTASGHVLSNVDPNYRSPLAGHASEKSTTHIVMVTAFDRLWKILEGNAPTSASESFVSG